VVEEYDTDIGPTIVAYRRRVQPSGRLYAMTEDDDYPYQIGDIAEYTVQHSQYIINNLPSKSTNPHKRQSEFDKHTAILNTAVSKKYIACLEQKIAHIARSQLPKVYVFPANRLPRNQTDIDNMAGDNPDKEGFCKATKAEISTVFGMGTWDPNEKLPEKIDKKLIGSSKMVYTKKYHPDGSFDKYKARIVFRGDKWYDLYQNKTYAGTVMSESVRLLLAIAAAEDLELQSADVNSAFLYGEIPETQFIYMRRPAGLTYTDMPSIVRLRKSLYGLPMASAKFREHSDSTLKNIGFKPTISDPRIYVKFYYDGTKAYISVHVDDFGIAASNLAIVETIIKELQNTYKVTINTSLEYYLGMLIWRDRPNRILKVYQPGFIADLIESFNVDTEHPPLTPMIDIPRPPESDDNPLLTPSESGQLLMGDYWNSTR
jgi:hypothetical protein